MANATVIPSPSDAEMIEILGSPKKWAEFYLVNPKDKNHNFKANYIQSTILDTLEESPYVKNVFRIHRRGGKSTTLAILCLYYCSVLEDAEILYFAPDDNKVADFWKTIEGYINATPSLKDSVRNHTKKPYMKQFANGTLLRAYTTGSSTGGGADRIRGLGGDIILLDEVPLMKDRDFDTIGPILEGDPHRKFKPIVFAAGTPMGSFGQFYKWCTAKKTAWKQFHIPITENPMYSPEDLRSIRKEFGERQWQQEYLVEFLDVGLTVFALSLIERAMRGEPYAITPKPSPWKVIPGAPRPIRKLWRTMGVDWDKMNKDGSGPNIAVMEVDEREAEEDRKAGDGIPRVIYRESIPQGPQCLIKTTHRIIELNDLMSPDVIYVDAGQGEQAIEELHLWGKTHPFTKLDRRVKRIQFGQGRVDVDPVTKEQVRSRFKTFMVNLMVRLFEHDQVIFDADDEIFKAQLTKYRIVNQTDNATTYSKEDEHIIDAVGLALTALWDIHKSPFRRDPARSVHVMPAPERVPMGSLTDSEQSQFRYRDPVMSSVLTVRKDNTPLGINGPRIESLGITTNGSDFGIRVVPESPAQSAGSSGASLGLRRSGPGRFGSSSVRSPVSRQRF